MNELRQFIAYPIFPKCTQIEDTYCNLLGGGFSRMWHPVVLPSSSDLSAEELPSLWIFYAPPYRVELKTLATPWDVCEMLTEILMTFQHHSVPSISSVRNHILETSPAQVHEDAAGNACVYSHASREHRTGSWEAWVLCFCL